MTSKEQTKIPYSQIDDSAVMQYLKSNPNFLRDHTDILARLDLSHNIADGTSSLIERQVTVLRDQNHRYKQQLNELITIAKSNDMVIAHMQSLALGLMGANNVHNILLVLQHSLKENFHADCVEIQCFTGSLLSNDPALDFLNITHHGNTSHLINHQLILSQGKAICGSSSYLDLENLQLFGNCMASSAVLIPLIKQKPLADQNLLYGLLAIGSNSSDRFFTGMETTFLDYMGKLISKKLDIILTENQTHGI